MKNLLHCCPLPILAIVILLSGCQIQQQTDQIEAEAAVETESSPKSTEEAAPNNSELTPELLYDILVASIAAQREQSDIALESLSRAAYQSRDRRIIAEAIQYAMDNEEYQQASELAQLLYRLEPDNYLVALSLAQAQFRLGENDSAYNLLVDLAISRTEDEVGALQDISSLLSRQDEASVFEEFMDHVELNENDPNLLLTAALLASRLNLESDYASLLDQTLESRPEWEIPSILKLSVLAGESFEAMADFADAHLQEYPQHNAVRLQYARALIQNENLEGSLDQLAKILETDPDSSEALFTIGIVYLDLERLDEANTALTRYLELNPGNDQARIFLAEIEFRNENYSSAASHLYGVSSQRYYLEAQIKLADIIDQRDGLEPALKHLRQIDTINDQEKTRIILEQDQLLRDHNQLDRSKATLDRGLERFPDDPDLLYNRGLLAAQLNLLELHERDMRKLIQIQPENAHAYNALGYTLADKTDRLDEALDLISKANQLLPDNPFILDSMGWIHYRLGNNDKALEFLLQALDGRKDAEIAAHLGEVLWASGKQDEAMDIWEQGLTWGPDNEVLKETIQRHTEKQQSANQPRPCLIPYPASIVHCDTPVFSA